MPDPNKAAARPSTAARPRRILLVGWDAADWQVINPLIERGEMPALARLIDGGVLANLATLHPKISPMLWNSIATGKTADKHGIHGFTELDPEIGVRPFASTSRRTKALWNIFQQALGWRCNVIGWWASHPAEPLKGKVITNYFARTRRISPQLWEVPEHSVHPPELMKDFGSLRMQVEEVTDQLLLPFIPRAAEIDQDKDHSLEVLAKLLSECCSIQATATAAMEEGEWDFTAVYFDSIDHFSHAFMPFHPPRMPHIAERDFELYKGVINSIYRFQDMMLERLVQLAGPDALVVVCSDHGFQCGALRPLANPNEPAGPVLWHRDFGMLVMNGPGVVRDERVYGATLLDIMPTLLTLAGLPVGEDMDGKPLLEALEDRTPPAKIPSWDAVPGDDGSHPPDFVWHAPAAVAQELNKQFAALGYVEDTSGDKEEAARDVEHENLYNLAQVYLSSDKTELAIGIMEKLIRFRPWESRYIHQLANAYLKAGYAQATDELLEQAYPPSGPAEDTPVTVWIMRIRAKLALGRIDEVRAGLQIAMKLMVRHPLAWAEIGWLWVEIKHLPNAEYCFRHAAQLDPDCAAAWQGLAAVYLRQHRNLDAIDAALEATQLLFHLPLAHFHLGVALAREGRTEPAIIALKRAVSMQPGLVVAHRLLASLHSADNAKSFLAGGYRTQAQRQFREKHLFRQSLRARAVEARDFPLIPPLTDRRRREQAERPDLTLQENASGKAFVIVSGLPRSGTSLMMQMLAAGGLPPQTDGRRVADRDNPEGYLEWEAIKRIGKEPGLLDEAGLENKAIKVISALLPSLPTRHRYKVVFMRRPPLEIARSQAKMISRLGTEGGWEGNEAAQAEKLQEHCDSILQFLRSKRKVFDWLEVDYPSLIAEPKSWAHRVSEFIGHELLPHRDRLEGVIRRDLHRNKTTQSVV